MVRSLSLERLISMHFYQTDLKHLKETDRKKMSTCAGKFHLKRNFVLSYSFDFFSDSRLVFLSLNHWKVTALLDIDRASYILLILDKKVADELCHFLLNLRRLLSAAIETFEYHIDAGEIGRG